MARSKNPDNYPPQLYSLLDRAVAAGEVSLLLPDAKAAQRIKAQLYALINAVARNEEASNMPYELRKANNWRLLAVSVSGESLTLRSKMADPAIQAIGAFLAEQAEPSLATDLATGLPPTQTPFLPILSDESSEDDRFRNFFSGKPAGEKDHD